MHVSIVPETIFRLGNLAVTNTLLTSWLVVLLIISGALFFYFRLKKIPGGFQNLIEAAVENFLGFMETVAGDRTLAQKFFPFVATIFIFVLVSNWSGIIPGVGAIGFFEAGEGGKAFVPFFRSVYSDLNMTLALAVITVVSSHIFGLLALGPRRHIGKFLTIKSPIAAFTGVLEIVSEFAKIISFAFRLFGNVFAGEVLLVIMAFLVPYVAPAPFLGLELFVGFIQALIFAVLAMVSFAGAVHAHSAEH